MAVRQYIGARYVPKFFDWEGSPEWRSGVAYEALTIVTRNGNSYTSKIPVPSNIGAPESNPEYWASTGIYNQQVESIRQDIIDAQGDIDSLEGRVTTAEGDIDSLEGRVTTAEGRVTTAEGDIDSLEGRVGTNENDITTLENTRMMKLRSRKFLFLGDSYIGSHDHTCVELACAYLGITNYENISVSGSSFHQGTFLAQLQNYSGNKNDVTDIWVIGGLNDCVGTSPSAELRSGIDNFFTYQKANYPNAHVYVCFVGHALDDAAQLGGRNWAARTWARWEYQQDISINGGTFIDNMWQGLVCNVAFMQSDHIHPSSEGQFELARFLVNYLTGVKVSALYPYYGVNGLTDAYYTITDNSVDIWSSRGIAFTGVAGQTISGDDSVTLTPAMPMYFNKPVYVPAFARAYMANDIPHQEIRGWLVANARTLSFRLNSVQSSGYRSFTFASNGNITFEVFQMHVPTISLL